MADDFDPDAFLKSDDDFDPDAFLGSQPVTASVAPSAGVPYGPEPPPKEYSTWDKISARGGGLLRGLTLGHGDKYSAKLDSFLTGKPEEQALREQYEKQKMREEAAPGAFKAYELAGAVMSPVDILTDPLAAPFNKLKKLEKLKKLTKMLDYMKVATKGGVVGAIAGEGYDNPLEEKDPDDWSGAAKGALAGFLLGPLAKAAPFATGGLVAGSTLGPMIGDKDATWETAGLTGLGALTDVVGGTQAGRNMAKMAATQTGKLMQLPEMAMEKTAQGVGYLADLLPAKVKNMYGVKSLLNPTLRPETHTSKLTKGLQEIVDSYEMKGSLKAFRAGLDKIKDFSDEAIGTIIQDPVKKQGLLEAIRDSFMAREKNAYSPKLESLDEQLMAALKEQPEILATPAISYLKVKVKDTIARDLRAAANKFPTVFKEISEAPEKSQKASQMIDDLLSEIEAGALNENLQLGSVGNVRKGQVGNVVIDLAEAEKTAPMSARLNEPSVNMDQYQQAMKALKDIARGENMLSAAGLGFSGGSVMNALTGGGSFNPVGLLPMGTSILGSFGRGLEKQAGKINPAKAAESWLANPTMLNALSKRPGTLGDLARGTMNDLQTKGNEGLKTKLFLFSMNPEFRKLVLGDTTSQGQQNPESILLEESVPPP